MHIKTVSNIKLYKIRRHFSAPAPYDLEANLAEQLLRLASLFRPGQKIAIAVGSRGISNLQQIVRIVVKFVKGRKCSPFVIPAMGSHGGASAAGQIQLLAGYGITEQMVAAPVNATMETVELGRLDGVRLFMNKLAHHSGGVILINRIKPHTDFHGNYESGLAKMSVIGLGSHDQALEIHRLGTLGLREKIPKVAAHIFQTGKVLAGIGIVEDAYDRTCLIRALGAGEIMNEEPKMLELARINMPSLPVEKMDVLIIDRIGKNISGVGLDPNVVGRYGIPGMPDADNPQIKSIVLDDLTPESHGNSLGTGLADVITKKLYHKIDFNSTYKNAYTSSFLERVKIPLIADNMLEALLYAMRNCGEVDLSVARIVRIPDTLHLDECYLSPPLYKEIASQIETLSGEQRLFDNHGDLRPF